MPKGAIILAARIERAILILRGVFPRMQGCAGQRWEKPERTWDEAA